MSFENFFAAQSVGKLIVVAGVNEESNKRAVALLKNKYFTESKFEIDESISEPDDCFFDGISDRVAAIFNIADKYFYDRKKCSENESIKFYTLTVQKYKPPGIYSLENMITAASSFLRGASAAVDVVFIAVDVVFIVNPDLSKVHIYKSRGYAFEPLSVRVFDLQ